MNIRRAIFNTLKAGFGSVGLELRVAPASGTLPLDFMPLHREIIGKVRDKTMTSVERLFSLIEACRYVSEAKIEGCVVECGVWKGGSSMAAALSLLKFGEANRNLYLYDTYEGMSAPEAVDRKIGDDELAAVKFEETKMSEDSSDWCYSPIEEVSQNLATTGYPKERLRFIKGKVEDTLPKQSPDEPIALLRLDTDWYASTKVELELLYPKLVPGGVLIIDDYGTWEGARKAVDEYFAERKIPILLNRIDRTGRIAVKP